ncbi:nuclear transport factor 2 family protein [Ralstonia pickettii]|nr:nuclear transport factor 2 family protein [Ralstonia pickettii]
MYRAIVEWKLRRAFAALNDGDCSVVLAAFANRVEHTFYGQHALGGTRHAPDSLRQWYARLLKLLPDLHFDVDSVVVRGWPWDTIAVVEWRDRFSLRDGQRCSNQGVHVLRLRWGRVVSLRIHCDTQKLQGILQALHDQGVVEAAMSPIIDTAPAHTAQA